MGFFKSTDAVGLEFDTGVIRFVKLKGSTPQATLVGVGQVEIPENAVVEGVVEDVPAVAGALEELWEKSRVGSREVTLGIFNQGVLLRRATFPKLEQKKLAQVVRYQSDEYFPIPVSELVMDFAVVGESEGENGPTLDVLLVAVQREVLEKSLHALAAAGLQPLIIDASPLALVRTVPLSQLSGIALVIDIANGLITLFLVADGIPRLARAVPHSLQYFSRELALPLGEVLENIRQAAAAVEEDQSYPPGLPAVFSEWGFVLANEIRSLVNYYLVQNTSGTVDRVIISGRGARMEGLAEFLREELDLPVETISPIENIKIAAATRDIVLGPTGLDFAVSIGLAMRGLLAL